MLVAFCIRNILIFRNSISCPDGIISFNAVFSGDGRGWGIEESEEITILFTHLCYLLMLDFIYIINAYVFFFCELCCHSFQSPIS
nr:Uncharacterised protein [Klebsiella pneumoniae]